MKTIRYDAEPSERVEEGYWVVVGRVNVASKSFNKVFLGDHVIFDGKPFVVTGLSTQHGNFIDVEIMKKKRERETLDNARNNKDVVNVACQQKIANFKTKVSKKSKEIKDKLQTEIDFYSDPINGIDL